MSMMNKVLAGKYQNQIVQGVDKRIYITKGLNDKVLIDKALVKKYDIFTDADTRGGRNDAHGGLLSSFLSGAIKDEVILTVRNGRAKIIALEYWSGEKSLLMVSEKICNAMTDTFGMAMRGK